jgi:hypothetical protein
MVDVIEAACRGGAQGKPVTGTTEVRAIKSPDFPNGPWCAVPAPVIASFM